jgi:TBCC domain-containing protein 1
MSRNLHHLLLLVASSDDCIDIEGVRSLEFLLLTSADKSHHLPLTALAVLPNQAAVNGASQDLKSFFLPHFEVWLRSCLVLNPFGPQAIKGGARDRRCPAFRSDVTGRIVTNIVSAPMGSHVVLIHGVNKQTLAKDYTGLDNSLVYIQNCRSSYIYLLGPMKSVVIEKCSRCVIVLGAVERCLMVNNCNGICLVAACRRAHVCTLSHSTLHLLTMTPPILFPGNHSLIFAPYNTHYPLLEDHLTRAGLNPLINSWDVPHSMVNEGGGVEPYTLMDPGNFYKLEVPFVMEGPTRVNPTILPGRYEEALKERKRRIDEWYGVVKEANLTPDKQRELQKIVQERFKVGSHTVTSMGMSPCRNGWKSLDTNEKYTTWDVTFRQETVHRHDNQWACHHGNHMDIYFLFYTNII